MNENKTKKCREQPLEMRRCNKAPGYQNPQYLMNIDCDGPIP